MLVVLGGLGLDVSGEAIPYVAGWGEGRALNAIIHFAQLILAHRVEAALGTAGNTPKKRPRPGHSTGTARMFWRWSVA
jgi:hypothetical protein